MISKISAISAYLENYDTELLRKQIEENSKNIEQGINELREINNAYLNK